MDGGLGFGGFLWGRGFYVGWRDGGVVLIRCEGLR